MRAVRGARYGSSATSVADLHLVHDQGDRLACEPGFHHRPEGPFAPSHEGASSLPVRDRLGGNLVAMLAPVRARYAPETGTIGMRFRDQPARTPAQAGLRTDPGVR